MYSIQDHVSRATRNHVEVQLQTGATLLETAMDGMQQMVDLNLGLVRATLDHVNLATRQLMSATDSSQFLSLAAAQAQPSARRVLDYGYYLTTIASDMQADFIKIVGARITDTNRKLIGLVEDVGKNAPAGFKTMVALLKSIVGGAVNGYGEMTPATSRTVEIMDDNVEPAVTQFAGAGRSYRSGASAK